MKDSYQNTKEFLKTYGASVVKEQKTRLRTFGKGGGTLEKSLNYQVSETKSGVGVSFLMETYGLYVDKGVEGSKTKKAGKGGKSIYKYKKKMPPTKALDKWVVRKGIAPRSESGRFLSRSSIKFAIARSIFLKGITPTNFFTIPIQRSQKRFITGVEKSLALDIEKNIQNRI